MHSRRRERRCLEGGTQTLTTSFQGEMPWGASETLRQDKGQGQGRHRLEEASHTRCSEMKGGGGREGGGRGGRSSCSTAVCSRRSELLSGIHATVFLLLATPMAMGFSAVRGPPTMSPTRCYAPRAGLCSLSMELQGGVDGKLGKPLGPEGMPGISRRRLLMAGSAIVAGGFFGVPLGTCEQEVVPQAKQGLLGIFPWGRQGDGKAGPSKPVAAEKASTLRAELEEIKRQLQANLKALDSQFASAIKDTARQLERAYEQEEDQDTVAVPDDVAFWNPMSDRDVVLYYRQAREELEKAIREVDLRIIAERGLEDERRVSANFEKKKAEIIKQIRSTEGRVKDGGLKKELDALEKEIMAYNDPLAPRDLQGSVNDKLAELRQFMGKKVLENEGLLRDIDALTPDWLRIIDTEIDGDKLYVTVPLLGGDVKVKKSVLSSAQVFTGGIFAGAAGELFKDVVSFPLDTIRTRLMTQGSFIADDDIETQVVAQNKASNRDVGGAAQPDPAPCDDAAAGGSSSKTVMLTRKPLPVSDERVYEERGERVLGETATLSRIDSAPLGGVGGDCLPEGTFSVTQPSRWPVVVDRIRTIGTAVVAQATTAVQVTMADIGSVKVDRGRLRPMRRRPREVLKKLGVGIRLKLPGELQARLDALPSKVQVPAGLFHNLYSGANPAFFFSPIQGAAFFGVKDFMYHELPGLGLDAVQIFIVSVIVSDSVYWLVRCPSETMKTRLQGSVDSGPLQSFKNIMAQDGIKGFYRGYIPLMQLDLPFTAVNFAIFSAYKAFIELSTGQDPTTSDLFVGGFIAAASTAGVTTPLSVCSTRILLAGASPKASVVKRPLVEPLEGGGVEEIPPVPTRRYETMLGTLKTVYSEEGIGALFNGVVPRVLQLGVNHALRFTGYEATKGAVTKEMLLGGTGFGVFVGGFESSRESLHPLIDAVVLAGDQLSGATVELLAPWIDLTIEFVTNTDVMYIICLVGFLL